MTTTPTTRRAGIAGLALAALAAGSPAARAADTGHIEQVALVDGTNQQLEFSSEVSGTGQVTSHDGNLVVFSTDAPLVAADDNNTTDVYLRDVAKGVTILVSQRKGKPGNDVSFEPTISASGDEIAFTTMATDLTGRKDRNGHTHDVVVKHLRTGKIELVSQTTAGSQSPRHSFAPVISGNGKAVSFQTFGSFDRRDGDRREDVYVRNLVRDRTVQASLLPNGRDVKVSVLNGDISDNGKRVVFGQANNLWMRDLGDGTTVRFWHEPNTAPCQFFPGGSAGRPAISGNGKFVAFASCAIALPDEDGDWADVYRMELPSGKTTRVHVASKENHSFSPSLSRTGRYVGFASDAPDLVHGDLEGVADAFVADIVTGEVVRASQNADGIGGDNDSGYGAVAISGDGRSLAYESYAGNLVPGDLFNQREVLVWRRG